MRWFDILLTPVEDYRKFINAEFAKSQAVGLFCILMAKSKEEELEAEIICKKADTFDFPVVFTTASDIVLINEYVKELQCYEWILDNREELHSDQIAKKEVLGRSSIVLGFLEKQLDKLLHNSYWYPCLGFRQGVYSHAELSALCSNICDSVYLKSPIIHSELLNKHKPSASATTALKQLMYKMIESEGEERLTLDGYTASSSLFNILLDATQIYTANENGRYSFQTPTDTALAGIWTESDQILEKKNQLTFQDLFTIWSRPPFGIKKGMHPFLGLSYVLTRRHKIALYVNDIYTLELTTVDIDTLLRAPQNFKLKNIELHTELKGLNEVLITALNKRQKTYRLTEESSPLQIGQSLVSIVYNLKEWVRKTKRLSKSTTRFREVVKSASDPYKLLYVDLPRLFVTAESKKSPATQICEALESALDELIDLYPNTLKNIAKMMLEELDIVLATENNIHELKTRAKNIKDVSGSFKVGAFAARLSTFNESYSDIAGIISLANGKSPTDWIDLDLENAHREILHLCTEFKKAEITTKIQNRPAHRKAVAFITNIGAEATIFEGEFSILESKEKEVKTLKTEIRQAFANVKDKNVLLAALTQLSIEQLTIEGTNNNQPSDV